jgi:hypothetical protein
MRESRSSGSVEGVMGNHDSYSDSCETAEAAILFQFQAAVVFAGDVSAV